MKVSAQDTKSLVNRQTDIFVALTQMYLYSCADMNLGGKAVDLKNVTSTVIGALGGQRSVARVVGCSQQAVGYWQKSGRIPAEAVLDIEGALSAAGSEITRYEIRPDVYGPRPGESQAA